MAIHHDYSGREEDDPGRWHPFQEDPDTGKIAEVRFRRMGRDKARDLDDKYRKPVSVEVKRKVVERLEISKDASIDMMMEAMDWCWIDVRNFFVGVHSKDTLVLFVQELEDPSLEVGQDVSLDGKLTSRLRRWCMDEIPGLTDFMMQIWSSGQQHLDVDKGRRHEARVEEALTRNLSSGSPSPSATASSPTAAPAAESAAPSDGEETSLASLPVS